jgi:hypothetical protein
VFFSCRMSVSAVKPSVRSTWSVESPQVAVAHMNGRNGYEDSNEETIAFETENFDAKGFVDAKFQSMTEKPTRNAKSIDLLLQYAGDSEAL